MVHSHIEIDRPPSEVFAYIADLERHREWQPAIVAVRKEPAGATAIGTRNFETRRVPGGPREFVTEIVEYDPPRRMVARGVGGGPVVPTVTITIDPLDAGRRSRVSLDLELAGRGVGKLFAMMAERSARKDVPRDQARLKQILEAAGRA